MIHNTSYIGINDTKLMIEPYVEPRIPRIIHHIWMTNGFEAKPFDEDFFDYLREGKEIMETGLYTYERHIWLNDKALTLTSMVNKLKELNMTIHNIDELEYINGHDNHREMRELRKMIRRL